MSIENGVSKLSVALLLSELEDIREISMVFRKLGVIPHFYEDLKSFWQGTLERIPSLAIVDVKKMNEGGLILKNHPSVMNEEMPLLFFYSDKTSPLLVSTQEIFHLGTVKKSKNYEGVFKGLLKRINKVLSLEQENINLKYSLQAKTEEVKRIEQEAFKVNKVDTYLSLAKEVANLIEENSHHTDFQTAVENVFQSIEAFAHFSIVELSFNGQKLLSPLCHVKKYRPIPSMWLGQVCKEGIEPFAQNMANQVAVDVLGSNVVPLMIYGQNNCPEKMIFIKAIDELCFEHFDWNLLESFINGFYASCKLREKKETKQTKNFSSMFEAMSFLDEYVFGSGVVSVGEQDLKRKDYRLVNLDLTIISEVLLKNGTQRFFWKKFKEDLVNKLEIQSRVEFRMIENGVVDLAFLVESKDLDYFFDELKEFSAKFPIWKYFENSEAVMFSELRPKVAMVPMSAFAYLKHTSLRNPTDTAKTLKSTDIAWNRETNEI